jgi:hypothetical protein
MPPIGGIILLNGSRITSDTNANALKNGADQSIEGIQVRKILTIINQKYN